MPSTTALSLPPPGELEARRRHATLVWFGLSVGALAAVVVGIVNFGLAIYAAASLPPPLQSSNLLMAAAMAPPWLGWTVGWLLARRRAFLALRELTHALDVQPGPPWGLLILPLVVVPGATASTWMAHPLAAPGALLCFCALMVGGGWIRAQPSWAIGVSVVWCASWAAASVLVDGAMSRMFLVLLGVALAPGGPVCILAADAIMAAAAGSKLARTLMVFMPRRERARQMLQEGDREAAIRHLSPLLTQAGPTAGVMRVFEDLWRWLPQQDERRARLAAAAALVFPMRPEPFEWLAAVTDERERAQQYRAFGEANRARSLNPATLLAALRRR